MRRRHTGTRGRQEELENFATMRHMARARLDEHVPATRDAVQLPTASSVDFSHEAVHRAIWLFPCPPAPPLPDPPTHSCPSQSFHFARKCPQCPLSDYFFLFLFLNLIPFHLLLLIFQHILTLSFSLIFGSKRQRYSTSFLSVAGHKLQASPDVSGPPRREIRGILSSGIACAYPPNSPLHSLFFHLHLRFHYHYLLFFLLLFLPCSAFCRRGTRRY